MNFNIGPELRSRLREAAEKTGHPESELIRKALMQFLDRIEKKPEVECSTRR
jgi:predicted transcriptional regulator